MPSLETVVRRPAVTSGARPPLLVLLHGVGGDETGLPALTADFDPRLLILSPRAPYRHGNGRYRWFDVDFTPDGPVIDAHEAESSRLLMVQYLNDAVMAYGADPRRVYLLGFSQGATLAYSLLLTAPARLRGAVLMAGRVLPEIAPLAAPIPALRHLTLLIQHGVADPVVPLARALDARDLFADMGVALGYREHAAGHELTPGMTTEARAFLHTQLNRTSPPAV